MAYDQNGSALKYFTPYATLGAGAITVLEEIDIGAASGDHGEMICMVACVLKRVWFEPIAELAGGTSTAPTVIFTKRPTPASATGEAVAATLTVPDATAIGTIIGLDIDTSDASSQFEPGDSLEISWTIGSGTPTGIGVWGAEFCDSPVHSVALTSGSVTEVTP